MQKHPEYKGVATTRLADQVQSQLKKSIFEGIYSPGQRLPSENEMVTMFGVSRIVVREAIRDLQRSGFVDIKRGPKGGAYVKQVKHDALSEMMRDILIMRKVPVAEIMEARLLFEPMVASLAAERATDQDIKMLEDYFSNEPDMGSDGYVKWNVKFHRLVAKASHNSMFEILSNILLDFVEEMVLRIRVKKTVAHDRESHPNILELIKKRDPKATRELYQEHLEEILPILTEFEKITL